ncbi:unnamed protein product, partial [Dicrocoelium dendriticum]
MNVPRCLFVCAVALCETAFGALCGRLPYYDHPLSPPGENPREKYSHWIREEQQSTRFDGGLFISFRVYKGVQITHFKSYSPENGTVFMLCNYQADVYSECCDLRKSRHSTTCDRVLFYDTSHETREYRLLRYEIRAQISTQKLEGAQAVIHVYFQTSEGQKYLTTSFCQLAKFVPCPEIIRLKWFEMYSDSIQYQDSPETHDLNYESFHERTYYKHEDERWNAEMFGWLPPNHLAKAFAFQRSPNLSTYDVIPLKGYIYSSNSHRNGPFSQLAYICPNYERNFFRSSWYVTVYVVIDAVLFVVIDEELQRQSGDNALTPIIDAAKSILAGKRVHFRYPSWRTPAMRLLNLKSARKAVYRAGERFRYQSAYAPVCIHFEGCEKKLRFEDAYTTQDRMKCDTLGGLLEIHNLEPHDTGIYSCKSDGGALPEIQGYYIIVLPHEDSITVFVNKQRWHRDKLALPEYPLKDALGRMYLQSDVFVNCKYVLPLGYDNYDGIDFEYMDVKTGAHLPFQHVDTWYSIQERNNITYRVFRIKKYETRGSVNQYRIQCSFRYEPIFRLVREHPDTPKERKTVSNYVLVYTSFHMEPKIVSSSIRTTHANVTDALNKTEAVYPKVTPHRLLRRTMVEDVLSGSFVVLHYVGALRVSVWTVEETEHGNFSYVPCLVKITPGSPYKLHLIELPEANGSETMAASQVDFRCGIGLATVVLVLSAFHHDAIGSADEQLEQSCITALIAVLKDSIGYTGLPGNTCIEIDPPGLKSTHRLVELHTVWRATVVVGEPVTMRWFPATDSFDIVRCLYTPPDSTQTQPVPDGFQQSNDAGKDYYELRKSNSTLTDSGLYACYQHTCPNCLTRIGPLRSLLVLPRGESMHIAFEQENLAQRPKGETTLVLLQDAVVNCSLPTSKSMVADNEWNFECVAYRRHQSPYQPTCGSVWRGAVHRYTRRYTIDGLGLYSHWTSLKVTCSVKLSNLVRDKHDDVVDPNKLIITKSAVAYVENYAYGRYFYDLTLGDQPIVSEIAKLSYGDAQRIPFQPGSPAPITYENYYRFRVTAFLGYPAGTMELWRVWWDGENVELESCPYFWIWHMRYEQRHKIHNRFLRMIDGNGVKQYLFECGFVQGHMGLVTAVLNTDNRDNERQTFMAHAVHWFKRYLVSIGEISVAPLIKSTMVRDPHSYFAIKLNFYPKVVTTVGSDFHIMGKVTSYHPYSTWCRRYYKGNPAESRKNLYYPREVRYHNRGPVFWLQYGSATLADSAVYRCTAYTQSSEELRSSGFPERTVIVLPTDAMLLMYLSEWKFQAGPTSPEGEFTQYLDGKEPFLFYLQSVEVRCIYPLPPFLRAHPNTSLKHEVYNKSSRRWTELTHVQGMRFLIAGGGQQLSTFTVTMVPPDLEITRARVTCVFNLDKIGTLHDVNRGKINSIQQMKSIDIQLQALIQPVIFDQHLKSNNSRLLENFRHTYGSRGISAVEFYQTGSKDRLLEGVMELDITAFLGIPVGRLVAWTFFNYTGIWKQDCFKQTERAYESLNIPRDLKQHPMYLKFGNRGFVRTTFLCTFRPEHTALIILAFTAHMYREESIRATLTQSAIHLVKRYLEYPKSTRVEVLANPLPFVAVAYRVHKVFIGWNASHKLGASWHLLLLYTLSDSVHDVRCYYSERRESDKIRMFYRVFTRKIDYYVSPFAVNRSTSGIYFCNHTHLGVDRVLAAPRRIVVLPNAHDLAIYVTSTSHVYHGSSMRDAGTLPHFKIGEAPYIWCVLPSIVDNQDAMLVEAQLMMDSAEKRKFAIQLISTIQNTRGELEYLHVAEGPQPEQVYTTLRAICTAQFTSSIFEADDLTPTSDLIVRSVQQITFEVRLSPVLFPMETHSTDHRLQKGLQRAPAKIDCAKTFAENAVVGFREQVAYIHVLLALGMPAGQVSANTYIVGDNRVIDEDCRITNTSVVEVVDVPRMIKAKYTEGFLSMANLANVSFMCVLRLEHDALIITAISLASPWDHTERVIHDTVGKYLRKWTHQRNTCEDKLRIHYPNNTNGTYQLVAIKPTWNDKVSTGSPVSMLARIYPSSPQSLRCLHHFLPFGVGRNPMQHGFRVVRSEGELGAFLVKDKVEFGDTGTYECEYPQGPRRIGFAKRYLYVRPDSSVLQLFITHQRFTSVRELRGAYNYCTANHRPMLFSKQSLHVHCVRPYTNGTQMDWNETVHIVLRPANGFNGTGDPESFITGQYRTESDHTYSITSYQLTAPAAHDYIGALHFTCELTFRRRDQHLEPFTTRTTRIIEVVPLRAPIIYHLMTEASDIVLQRQIRNVPVSVLSTWEFSDSNTNASFVRENNTSLMVPAYLGHPRGHLTVWMLYEYEKRWHAERCRKLRVVNWTNEQAATLSADMGGLLPSQDPNIVTVTFHCGIRLEHSVIVIGVYQCYAPYLEAMQVDRAFLASVISNIKSWIVQPSNATIRVPMLPEGSSGIAHPTKITVYWKGYFHIGDRMSLPGYLGDSDADVDERRYRVYCVYQMTTKSPMESLHGSTHLLALPQTYTFQLIKRELHAHDFGYYSCKVDHKDRTQTKGTVGFVQRLLAVLPGPQSIRMILNPKLLDVRKDLTEKHSRCAHSSNPCMSPDATTYVYFGGFISPVMRDIDTILSANLLGRNQSERIPLVYTEESHDTYHGEILMLKGRLKVPDVVPYLSEIRITGRLNFNTLPPVLRSYSSPRTPWTVTANRTISIHVEYMPEIFTALTTASLVGIQIALRTQRVNSVFSSQTFQTSGPTGRLLEGLMELNLTTYIGTPPGLSAVFMLNVRDGRIRAEHCQHKTTELTEATIPESVKRTSIYRYSMGERFEQIHSHCPLRPTHMALVVAVVNSMDPIVSPALTRKRFEHTLVGRVEQWLGNPSDLSPMPIRLPPRHNVVYQLVHLKIGWRGVIPEGTPVVLFGTTMTRSVRCYYQSDANGTKIQVGTVGSEFSIVQGEAGLTFELICPRAQLTDTGIYQCITDSCLWCNSRHELVVLPLRLEVRTVLSEKQSIEDLGPVETYGFVDEQGQPYTYPGQSFYVHCMSRTDIPVSIRPHMHFHFSKPPLTAEFLGNYVFSSGAPQSHMDATYSTHGLAHRISVPLDFTVAETVHITCVFAYPINMSHYDINTGILRKHYNCTRYVQLRARQTPRILNNMISTDYAQLTELLRNPVASNIDAVTLNLHTNHGPVKESIIEVKYTAILGQPRGWTGVYTVLQDTVDVAAEQCSEVAWAEADNGSSMGEENIRVKTNIDMDLVEPSKLFTFRFRCFLQLRTVGLFVVAMHSMTTPYDVRALTKEFVNSVGRTVSEAMGDARRNPRQAPSFPPYTDGTYRLARINVGWDASVEVGSVIRMFGRLTKDGGGDPICMYSADADNWTPVNVSGAFGLRIVKSMGYFILHKPKAELGDSGWYRCRLADCLYCSSNMGMTERQLVVMPDQSVLQIRLHMTDELNRLAQTCGLGDIFVLQPQIEYVLNCIHSVPMGFPYPLVASAGVHFKNESRWMDLQDKDAPQTQMTAERATRFNRSIPFTLPHPSSGDLYEVDLVCALQLDEFSVQYDLIKMRPGRKLSKKVTVMVTHVRPPEFVTNSIGADEPSIAEVLQSVAAGRLDRKSFSTNIGKSIVLEGPIGISFRIYSGSPPGWTFGWSIIKWKHTLWTDNCLFLQDKPHANRTQNVSVTCMMQPENVALVLVAANMPGTQWTRSMVEAHVRQAVLTNISEWMDLNNKTTESDRWSACYNAAYRYAPVQVQWNSTVREGDRVVMYGLLNGRQADEDLKCMRNWKPIQWNDHIALRPNPVGDYFTLTIVHAIYSDTGIYECRPDHTVTSQSEFWGLGPRWLRVIPDSSKTTKCGLSVDKAGSKRLRNGGQATNELDYLMAGEKAYVTCMFETGFAEFYRPVFRLKHHMLDTSTGHSEPADITFNIVVSSHASGTFTMYVYEIEGIRSRFYKGPLTATCEAVIKLHHVDEGSTRQHVVSCQQTYAVLEPANGEVLIETLSKDYESQPVPLGTEFKCTGGYGSPPLKHNWTPNNIGQYDGISSVRVPDTSNPGDHHDWIGPRQTFTDQPTNGLVIKEDKLLIPYDRRYRGMSYVYTCWGNNSIEGEVWSVRKTIRFTVMICPTRVVPLDLTVLLSSRLLSRCTLEGNPDREIQFYGHFYLPLVQQLILGLPYGPTQVQFHFIRDDVFGHNTSNSFPLAAFNQQLSREQLLRTVNPKDWKPKTDPGGCGASPIIFDSVIAHLARLRHVPLPGREHVLVLPFDDFTDIRISNETSSLLSMLLRTNLSILLLSTVGQGAYGSATISKLEKLFSPLRTINILPNFDGDTDCLRCRPRLEAVTFRIARDEFFNAVCEATSIVLPDSCPAPALHFSIPSRHWYDGQHLGITCTANLSQPFRGQTATGLAICLVNETALQQLEQGPLNVQHLMNACNYELANGVTSVIDEPSEFSVNAQ